MKDRMQKMISQCSRCGKCRSICPIFAESLCEFNVARGRLAVLQAFDQHPSVKALEALSSCMLCGACESRCSNDVPVTEIIREKRAEIGPGRLKSLLQNHLLAKPKNLRTAARAFHGSRELFLKQLPADSGLHLRAGLSALLGERRIPSSNGNELFVRYGTKKKSSKNALFTGCVGGHLLPELGEAAIRLIRSVGESVDLPMDQACCGLMAYGSGDDAGAKKSADIFFAAFSGYDRIFTLCSSCKHMLRRQLPKIDSSYTDISSRVIDIHDFLAGADIPWEAPEGFEINSVAYHTPCHDRFGDGAGASIALLKKLPIGELLPLEDQCCGFGGSFTLTNKKVSRMIAERRAQGILQSGAKTVVTSCSGCILGLVDGVKGLSPRPKIRNLMELALMMLPSNPQN